MPRMKTQQTDSGNDCPGGFRWKQETTLGGKAKKFCWQIDENNSLHIARKFKNGDSWRWKIGTFTEEEINMIQAYMEPIREVILSNDVEDVPAGNADDGLGRFIFEEIESNPTAAQLSSQIGALFYYAGIWKWNGVKRGIKLQKIPNTNWQQKLTERYNA